jgi:hypothetical protein
VQHTAHRERFTNCIAFERVADCMENILIFHGQRWQVIFALNWNIWSFVESQLRGSWDLKNVLVLSGEVNAAYATTCEEYIRFAWGEWGLDIFRSLVDICQNSGKPSVFSRAHFWLCYQRCLVHCVIISHS